MDFAAVRQCGSARQCERQCVEVRTVVCARCARQRAVVRLVVFGSARGSVRLSGSAAVCGSVSVGVWQCARSCIAVRQCVAVHVAARGSAAVRVWQCGSACVAVRQCMCGSAAVCGSAEVRVWQCGSVRQYGSGRRGSVRLSGSAAVCLSVWQCDSVRQCSSAAVCVWQCAAVCSSAAVLVWQ
jgi:hypothetical protein